MSTYALQLESASPTHPGSRPNRTVIRAVLFENAGERRHVIDILEEDLDKNSLRRLRRRVWNETVFANMDDSEFKKLWKDAADLWRFNQDPRVATRDEYIRYLENKLLAIGMTKQCSSCIHLCHPIWGTPFGSNQCCGECDEH